MEGEGGQRERTDQFYSSLSVAKRNGQPYAKVRLRFTIERKIDLSLGCGIIFYFILKMKNATWVRGTGNGTAGEEGDERAFPARQFRSRGEIDRDDVQIILF